MKRAFALTLGGDEIGLPVGGRDSYRQTYEYIIGSGRKMTRSELQYTNDEHHVEIKLINIC